MQYFVNQFSYIKITLFTIFQHFETTENDIIFLKKSQLQKIFSHTNTTHTRIDTHILFKNIL